jgi:enoyl-[acyl-carrier protein] reductase III
MFEQVQERLGRVDFFVSNASASNFHHFMDLKPHHLERTYNLNVRAFVVGTQRAVKLMPDGGRVVVLSSYGSIRSFPTYANLGSAKAALETWARYMAVELAPHGVNVNAVNGGIIETDSSSYFYATGRVPSLETVLPKIPKRRMGTAAEVADSVLFLLSPEAEYVTGTTLIVDGGLTAIAPPFHADMAAGAEAGALDTLSELFR